MSKIELIKQVRPAQMNSARKATLHLILALTFVFSIVGTGIYGGALLVKAIRDHYCIDYDLELKIAIRGASLLNKHNISGDEWTRQWTVAYEICLRFNGDEDWLPCAEYILKAQRGEHWYDDTQGVTSYGGESYTTRVNPPAGTPNVMYVPNIVYYYKQFPGYDIER